MDTASRKAQAITLAVEVKTMRVYLSRAMWAVGLLLLVPGVSGAQNFFEDIKREVSNGAKAVEEGAKHVTKEAVQEVDKAKKAAVGAGVPAPLVEIVTGPTAGAIDTLEKATHGQAPSPVDVIRMNPAVHTPLVGIGTVTGFFAKIEAAIDAATEAARQATNTTEKAGNVMDQVSAFLRTLTSRLFGDSGVLLPLTLLAWGLVAYMGLVILGRIKMLFTRRQMAPSKRRASPAVENVEEVEDLDELEVERPRRHRRVVVVRRRAA